MLSSQCVHWIVCDWTYVNCVNTMSKFIFVPLLSLIVFVMISECKINSELVWLCDFCFTTIKLFDSIGVSDGAATECGPNERFNERGPSCQMTCAGLNQHCCENYFVPPSACYCIDGYARQKTDKKCIPIASQPCQDEAVPADPIDCSARWPANGYWSS